MANAFDALASVERIATVEKALTANGFFPLTVTSGAEALAKELILHKEHPMMGRKVHVILVNEKLGF
ncbi:MAG: hypothetical protein Q7J45_03600 [bacterium]|nr:hypothetical protein [bacterium]